LQLINYFSIILLEKRLKGETMKEQKEMPDQLWKTIIEDLFDEFVKFFIPLLYDVIDFSKGIISRDTELQKIVKKSKELNKYGDKLVQVYLKDGTEQWILIHIEIQGYKDELFSERMFRMFYRIYDRYNKKIVALAIFTDGIKNYKPNKFEYEYFKTKLNYEYFTYKILEQEEKELEKSENAFALVILAGLYTLKTEGKTNSKIEQRYIFKKKLTELLRERGYSKEKILNLNSASNFYKNINLPNFAVKP